MQFVLVKPMQPSLKYENFSVKKAKTKWHAVRPYKSWLNSMWNFAPSIFCGVDWYAAEYFLMALTRGEMTSAFTGSSVQY